MGVVWTAVDKIHKKQRFFYWAEWGNNGQRFPPDDFSKNDFAPSDLLRQEQQ